MYFYISACNFCTLRHQISPGNYLKIREWSLVLNSVLPLRSAIRCPVTTQEAVQFYKVGRVGLEISIHACLTGRQVTP